MRRFAAALGLVIAAAATAPALGSDSARPLRVVTLNLLHGGASSGLTGDTRDLDTRLAIVIEELRRLAPDVVALQEASEGRRRRTDPSPSSPPTPPATRARCAAWARS